MKKFIRLRDLENVVSEKVDMKNLMDEAYGFENKGIFRAFKLVKVFKQVKHDLEIVRATDVSKIAFKECFIKKPDHIEKITYSAMMELNGVLHKEHDIPLSEIIAKVIATTCFSENHIQDYNSETRAFKNFQNRILNSPLLEMFGLYNWIMKSFKESNDSWEEKFFSVEVEDPDYELAGGKRMAQFNVINTIKKTCKDFNRNDTEAWQMPYYMVQMNNYEAASSAYTQSQMTMLKESKMRTERDRQSGHN